MKIQDDPVPRYALHGNTMTIPAINCAKSSISTASSQLFIAKISRLYAYTAGE